MASVLRFDPAEHMHLIPYLAAVHASCITNDKTMATFLPPLSQEKLLAWWKNAILEVSDGSRAIFVLIKAVLAPGERANGTDVAGTVMLSMRPSETAARRGGIEKLLVHPTYRGMGAARALLRELESFAVTYGKSILTLETETGSPAVVVYKKLGYIEAGVIPRCSLSVTGEMMDVTVLYKHL